MYKALVCSFILLTTHMQLRVYAQSADTTVKEIPRIKPLLIVPVALVGYGFASLHAPVLERWNKGVNSSIYQPGCNQHIGIDDYLQWGPAIAVYGLNLAGIKGRNNLVNRSFIFGMATFFQGSSTHLLKRAIGETRPDGTNALSFPSGHTATAFASAEFMRMEYKDVSPWYGIAGYAAAATTGYLRMYNNRHWLGDVLAGAGIGILSTQAAYFLYPKINRLVHKKRHQPVYSL
jgi:hypothetical protein